MIEIEELLEQEEIHYKQRSRVTWLKNGDRKTQFFQGFASERRKKIFIKRIKNDQWVWLEGTNSLNPHIGDYFTNLFSSEVQEIDTGLLGENSTKS